MLALLDSNCAFPTVLAVKITVPSLTGLIILPVCLSVLIVAEPAPAPIVEAIEYTIVPPAVPASEAASTATVVFIASVAKV